MLALLQKTHLIGDRYGIRAAEFLQHVMAKLIARSVRVPTCPIQKMLYPVRNRLAHPLGQLPAVLPRAVAHSTLKIGKTALPRLGMRKQARDQAMRTQQLLLPAR